jgi:hypothetical protein
MVFTSLQHLNPYDRNAVIQVNISRKWEFRGGKDNGPLPHIDLVLADNEVRKFEILSYREIQQKKQGP